jgi:hypothetical protein
MGDSKYIFEHSDNLFYIVNTIGILLFVFTIYQLYKIKNKDRFFYHRQDDGKEVRRLPYAVGIAIVGLILIVFVAPSEHNLYKRIEKNQAEAIGTTLEKVYEGHFREIKYKFIVNGKIYYAECEYNYDGEQIEGIVVPNGHYKVLYNKSNPEESVMDFKANTDSINN